MKKGLFLIAGLLFLAACRNLDDKAKENIDSNAAKAEDPAGQSLVDTTNFTQIEWLDPIEKQLGKLTPGKEVEITWKFRNAGKKPLIIENATASCGCTIPEKPEKPLAPGEEGVIKAKFNGSGMGVIVKQVHVMANTTPTKEHTLSFGGEITEKK